MQLRPMAAYLTDRVPRKDEREHNAFQHIYLECGVAACYESLQDMHHALLTCL